MEIYAEHYGKFFQPNERLGYSRRHEASRENFPSFNDPCK